LKQRIPSEFSREHLNNFQGIATLFVGEEMAMEVNMRFDHGYKTSYITGRWKLFCQKYNLQVNDTCKFVMTQREPLLFTIIINRVRKEPNPKMLQGFSFFSIGFVVFVIKNVFKLLFNGLISLIHYKVIKKGSLVIIML
jgi:hypothetical protein